MSTISDWPRLLGELLLNRTTAQFAATVELLARELGAPFPRFYLYDMDAGTLTRGQQTLQVDNRSMAGECALYCEILETDHGLALPVTRYGSLIGVLVADRGADRECLTQLAGAVGLMHEPVKAREEATTTLAALEGLLVQAVDRMAPGGSGHVDRVARIASELATMLDLSPQSRQDLWDAAHFHDVGWLVLKTDTADDREKDHTEAGAIFLERTEALRPLAALIEPHHESYPSKKPRAIEAWVLSLAEDLDEYFSKRCEQTLEERTRSFYAERTVRHHPEVVDALSGLVDSGRLAAIYR